MKKVIAIDGPAGAGKSTVAKKVAQILNFKYLDTGALYRAVAYHFFKKLGNIETLTEEDVKKELKILKIYYEDSKVFLFNEDVSYKIRDPKVGVITSLIAAKKSVRDFLLPLQREFAEKYDTVAEGRDTTTVVFPDAWRKFYLDASEQVRAQRRYEQLKSMEKNITFSEAFQDILTRDRIDSSRENSPLSVSSEAIYIDTSNLSVEEVISKILEKVAEIS